MTANKTMTIDATNSGSGEGKLILSASDEVVITEIVMLL